MPSYDYQCPKCGKLCEVIKSIKEFDRVELCPECKEEMSRGIPTKTSFSLKGGGWYKDSYSKKG